MKLTMKSYPLILLFILSVSILTSCEQAGVEPSLGVAPGGGTLTSYKAYTISYVAGPDEVHGRVVFWKESTGRTLVQVSLYNTAEGTTYAAGIFSGTASSGSDTKIQDLYTISGATGEFETHKFFVIDDDDFYSTLSTFDAHIQVMSSDEDDLIASGDVGMNAAPVESK
jgi:hypothetical protein